MPAEPRLGNARFSPDFPGLLAVLGDEIHNRRRIV